MTEITIDAEPIVETPPAQPPVISKYFQATDSLGKSLMRVLLDHIRSLPEQWHKISERRQEELLESLGDSVHAAVQHGARALMAAGFPHVAATLDSVTIKDGVKATVIFDRSEADIDAISHQVKRQLVLVLVDPETYGQGVYDFEADADQPGLPLEEPPTNPAIGAAFGAMANAPDYPSPEDYTPTPPVGHGG